MTLQDITRQLVDQHGYSQASLARELLEHGVSCSQPTIWRILQGSETTDTIGQALRKLHKEKARSVAA